MRQDNHVKIASQGSENPYHLELILGSFNGVEEQLKMMDVIPSTFELAQNIPNPFNPVVTIPFQLAETGPGTINIYNILGQEVVSFNLGGLTAGKHIYTWQPSREYNISSGVFLIRMKTAHGSSIKKIIYLK